MAMTTPTFSRRRRCEVLQVDASKGQELWQVSLTLAMMTMPSTPFSRRGKRGGVYDHDNTLFQEREDIHDHGDTLFFREE